MLRLLLLLFVRYRSFYVVVGVVVCCEYIIASIVAIVKMFATIDESLYICTIKGC